MSTTWARGVAAGHLALTRPGTPQEVQGMATTMSIAESAVQVGIPPEKAREKWTEWTQEGGPGMGLKTGGKSQGGAAAQLPEELRKAEAGTAYFEPGQNDRTAV